MKKVLILIILLLCLSILSSCEKKSETDIIKPIDVELMNELPFEINLPKYVELITNTSDYLIIKHDNMNIRDQKYNIEYSQSCSEGRVIYRQYVSTKKVNNKYILMFKFGFMDSLFEKITPPMYEEVFPFEHGCAVVKTDSGYGVLDLECFEILKCNHQNKPEILDEYIRVLTDRDEKNYEYDYFNKEDGSFLFTLKMGFDEESNSYNMLKSTATEAEKPINDLPGFESESVVPFKDNETSFWGYVDYLKNTVIPPIFDEAYPFSEGRAIVKMDGKFGYINENGEIVIDPIYKMAYDFHEGIACVMQDGKFGYITYNGGTMLDLKYSIAKSFSEGLAAVKTDAGYSYINTEGEIIISGNYISAGEFSQGYALVKNKDDKYLYIDKFGNHAFNELVFIKGMDINEDGYGFAMSYDLVYEGNLETGGTSNEAVYKIYLINLKRK